LDFEEAEAKELLRQAGIPVPPGEVCRDAEAAAAAAGRLGRCAVKAQVPSGKRGKAGGIRLANDPQEARAAAKAILGMAIGGHKVERVLVEKCADIAEELYVAVLNDVATRAPMVLFSRSGGMDVEDMAERIVRIPVNIDAGFQAGQGLDKDIHSFVKRLYDLYVQTDAELLEVNPLVRLKGGGLLALDCKLTVDDASLFRQPELAGKGAREKMTELERRARELGLKYIELPGNVGVLANGAGLTMTTMDVIEHCGGAPANFLEIGGDPLVLPVVVPPVHVDVGQQVHRNNRGAADVDIEQIRVHELDAPDHVGLARVRVAFLDAPRIDVDAERACAEVHGRRNRDTPVARAQIDDEVTSRDLRNTQHLVDDDLRRGDIRHVVGLRPGAERSQTCERGSPCEHRGAAAHAHPTALRSSP